MDEARRRELRDAVRPQGDDLADPLFLPLADEIIHNEQARRTQRKLARFDSLLGQAIRQPSLPEGLLARLQARLAAEESVSALGLAPASVDSAHDETLPCDSPSEAKPGAPAIASQTGDASPVDSAPQPRGWTRRGVLQLSAGALALAGLGAATYLYLPNSGYTVDNLLAAGRRESDRAFADAAKWKPRGEAPRKRFSPDLDWDSVAGWKPWSDFNGLSGDVFRLQARAAQGVLEAGLFQFAAPLNLPAGFPTSPATFQDTAGKLASTWAKSGSLFVLVIHGSELQARSVRHFRVRALVT